MNTGDKFYKNETIKNIFSDFPKKADVSYGHYQVVYNNGYIKNKKAKDIKNIWKGMFTSHQSFFVKTSILKKLKFNIQNRIAADYEFIYKVYSMNYIFFNSNQIVCSVRSSGLSDIKRIESIKSQWSVAKKYSKSIKVDLFYVWLIFNEFVKLQIKKILPDNFIMFIIKMFKK